jgi:hypothetical protein
MYEDVQGANDRVATCFVLGRNRDAILTLIPVISTEMFRGFTQLVRENVRVLSQLIPPNLHGALFPYHLLISIPSFVKFTVHLSLMPTLVLNAAAPLHSPIHPLVSPRSSLYFLLCRYKWLHHKQLNKCSQYEAAKLQEDSSIKLNTKVFRRLRNEALENKAFETELLGSEQTYEGTPATAVRVRANPVPVIRVLWVAFHKCSCLRFHKMSGKMHACSTLEKSTHVLRIISVHFICLTLVTVTNALNNTTSWQVSILQLRGIRRHIKTFHRNRGN